MNSRIGEPVVAFLPIELIATADWFVPIGMEERTIHVWGFSLDGSKPFVEQCGAWLSEDEWERATRFIREQDRVRFVCAHGALRAVLGRYLGIAPHEVTVHRREAGKPFLMRTGGDRSTITFNMSHAHGRALIAVTEGREVGVDLERIRPDIEAVKLSERYFVPSEHAAIMQLDQKQRAAMFIRYWVGKEAVLKAQGIGLQALSRCEIQMCADGVCARVLTPEGIPLQENWRIRFLSCGEGWEAAVAAQGSDWVVQCGLTGS